MRKIFDREMILIITICVVLMAGCAAGLQNKPVIDQQRMIGSDAIAQYTAWRTASLRLLEDPNVSNDTKVFIAYQVNPKLNKLGTAIDEYCKLVDAGNKASPATWQGLIAELAPIMVQLGGMK